MDAETPPAGRWMLVRVDRRDLGRDAWAYRKGSAKGTRDARRATPFPDQVRAEIAAATLTPVGSADFLYVAVPITASDVRPRRPRPGAAPVQLELPGASFDVDRSDVGRVLRRINARRASFRAALQETRVGNASRHDTT